MSPEAPRVFDARPFATGRRPLLQKHFRIEIGGETLAFCYIRKNASSAFKALFLALSPAGRRAARYASPMAFLRARHRAGPEGVAAAQRSLLVVRDPLDRLVSTYRNKFVQRRGHAGIFANYARVTGEDPEEATLADVVLRQAAAPCEELDPHLSPQVDHLLPLAYTDAVTLDRLPGLMSEILGGETANRFFRAPVNATRDFAGARLAEPWRRPSRELHDLFVRTGEMPAAADLVTPEIAAAAAALYRADVALVASVAARKTQP